MTKKAKTTKSTKKAPKAAIVKKKAVKVIKKPKDNLFKVGQKIFIISVIDCIPRITDHIFKGYRASAGWGNYDEDSYTHLASMYQTKEAAQEALKKAAQDQMNTLKHGREVLTSRISETDKKIQTLEKLLIS